MKRWICRHIIHVQSLKDHKICWCGEVTFENNPPPPPGYGIES